MLSAPGWGVPVGQQSAFLKRRTLGWLVKPGWTWRFPLFQSPVSPHLYVNSAGSVGDMGVLWGRRYQPPRIQKDMVLECPCVLWKP